MQEHCPLYSLGLGLRDVFLLPKQKTHRKVKVRSYLPTPPLGQDMTQGQFLSEV